MVNPVLTIFKAALPYRFLILFFFLAADRFLETVVTMKRRKRRRCSNVGVDGLVARDLIDDDVRIDDAVTRF